MVELLKLEVEGFGKFAKNKVINFKKGINFITGLNETGKSTILEAILASLFKYTSTKINPFFCWKNEDVCKASLTYKTDKGETFRVASDYMNGKRKLEKITKSRVSEISTANTAIAQRIKEHFGFAEQKVFENTTFIRQAQMAILGDATSKVKIKEMIEEVLVGTAEASATKALKKMKAVETACGKEAKKLQTDLDELKGELDQAEANRAGMDEDSSDYEEVSKDLSKKSKEFEKLKDMHEKFQKKEECTTELKNLNKDVKNVDKTLLGIKDIIKKRDKLINKKEEYANYEDLSKEDLSAIKDSIKKLNDAEVALKTYGKSGGKKKVVEEKLDPQYLVLFIVGIILSIVIIGIPLAIYAYRRMKIKEEKEVVDEEREEEINELNESMSKSKKDLSKRTKNIKDFNKDTFLESYNQYSGIVNKLDSHSSSILALIETELEKDEIEDDEDENIKKIESKKIELLNKLTINQNNLKKYKLVKFSEEDSMNLETLEEEVEKLGKRKVALKTSVDKTKELIKSPEEIKEEVDARELTIQELKEKAEEHKSAYKFLEMAETEVQHKFTPSIEKNSIPLLKEVTNTKYSNLKMDEENLNLTIKAPEIKKYVPVDILSQGAKDQVYFTVRTVLTDLLSGKINNPLILDDPFMNFDDTRLKRTINAIKKISQNKQIIFMSHRFYNKKFKNFADNVIEVK